MKTIVGLVADHKEAKALMKELTRRGFRHEDLELIRMQAGGEASREAGRLFQSMEEFFGEEAPEVRGYYANVDPKGMIVTVFAEDEAAERAAAAMLRHGPVRIYNHSTEPPVVEELARSSHPYTESDAP